MKIQQKSISDKSELFLAPIPKWITHYGFILMLFVALLLLFFSFIVKYPETKMVKVLLTKKNAATVMSFDTYKQIARDQNVVVNIPILGKLNGTIDAATSQLTGNSVISQLSFKPGKYAGFIKDTVYCQGEITLNNTTLINRIIKR